jgi:glycosyltransferase involved in cell wall biosynthesis
MKSVRVAVTGRGFDVLHVCNPPETYWPLARFWKRLGRRFLFDHHDLSPEMFQVKFDAEGGLALAGLRWLERKTFEAADLVVTANESHKRIAVERGGKAPGDVYVVRSGPDPKRLTVHPPDPAWRNGRRHLLVYLGEICKQDRVDHLIRAVKLLRDTHGRDDVHCVLVGGGPHQPSIRPTPRSSASPTAAPSQAG